MGPGTGRHGADSCVDTELCLQRVTLDTCHNKQLNTMLWDGIFIKYRQTNSKLLRSGQYTSDTCFVTLLFAHVWPRTAGSTTTTPSES